MIKCSVKVILGMLLAISVAYAQAPVAKVSVLATGKLLLNGQPSSLAAIETAFQGLKGSKGTVWYYRENATAEPPAEGMAVMNLVIKYNLPVSMSSKPDFSDYVDFGDNGRSKPRQPYSTSDGKWQKADNGEQH
jgi:hypothetical protein